MYKQVYFSMEYFNKSNKAKATIKQLNEALDILSQVGIPIAEKTERSLEKMAMTFLAVAGVTKSWTEAKDNRFLKTRDIINFINRNFEEDISSGSYDDIRRKDLRLLVLGGLVLNSSDKPNAATNDPTRGYNLETTFKNLVITYKTDSWTVNLENYLANKVLLKDQLSRNRNMDKVPISLPNGKQLELSAGQIGRAHV